MLRSIALTLVLMTPAVAAPGESTPAGNKEIVRRFVEVVLDGGDFARVAEFVSADYADERLPSSAGGPADVVEVEGLRRRVFPDLSFEIEDLMAEADRVMVLLRLRGTHSGEALGVGATGNDLDMRVMRIYRLAGGKLIESEELSDMIQLYRATGYRIERPIDVREADGR